jgi:hypothetical protein
MGLLGKDLTKNKLNTPYNNNVEEKKKASKINTNEHNYEFGSEYGASQEKNSRLLGESARNATNRYQYEFGNEASISAKDSPLARGANIANAFSQVNAASTDSASRSGYFGRYNEEYTTESPQNTEISQKNRTSHLKQKFQNNLRQNYNVEFSEDELINDCDQDCENCTRCQNKR